jgi:hypothetical protein
MSCASLVPTRVRVGARASKAAVTRRVAVASARKEEAPKARRGILRGAGMASVMASSSPALAATPPIVGELARSDLWFGWYFAPGGVVLGPALILTVFLVGGAIFEKVTGKAVSNKPFKKKD